MINILACSTVGQAGTRGARLLRSRTPGGWLTGLDWGWGLEDYAEVGFGLFARSSALICGRCLVGGSATRRGSGWCRMALYRQLTTPFGTMTRRARRLS